MVSMTRGYGQYCPLALASELLCQRWTILVLSRVVDGCHRYSEIHRGVPQISPSLLTKRLVELEEAGLIQKVAVGGEKPTHEYRLTAAGRDAIAIIDQMAIWGQQWARDMTEQDLDPAFLVWSMHLRMNTDAMPPGRTVLEFDFSGAPKDCSRFWIVCTDGSVEMCLKDPGLDVDVAVASDLLRFVEAWRGFRDLRGEIRAGRIRVHGSRDLASQLPEWLMLSGLATFPRQRSGREKRLASRAGRSATR